MTLSILINFQSDRNLFTNGLAGYELKNHAMGISRRCSSSYSEFLKYICNSRAYLIALRMCRYFKYG